MIYNDRGKKNLVLQFYQLLWLVYWAVHSLHWLRKFYWTIPSFPFSSVFSPWAKSFFRSKNWAYFISKSQLGDGNSSLICSKSDSKDRDVTILIRKNKILPGGKRENSLIKYCLNYLKIYCICLMFKAKESGKVTEHEIAFNK